MNIEITPNVFYIFLFLSIIFIFFILSSSFLIHFHKLATSTWLNISLVSLVTYRKKWLLNQVNLLKRPRIKSLWTHINHSELTPLIRSCCLISESRYLISPLWLNFWIQYKHCMGHVIEGFMNIKVKDGSSIYPLLTSIEIKI